MCDKAVGDGMRENAQSRCEENTKSDRIVPTTLLSMGGSTVGFVN